MSTTPRHSEGTTKVQQLCALTISAGPGPEIFMLGTRAAATDLRAQVEKALDNASAVCIDFDGYLTSQSFMDEFLGVLITRYGPSILDRLVLKNCHEEVRAAAQFVTSIRSKEFMQARA
jgi:STAS-like domain of unknown function (DUF4325)